MAPSSGAASVSHLTSFCLYYFCRIQIVGQMDSVAGDRRIGEDMEGTQAAFSSNIGTAGLWVHQPQAQLGQSREELGQVPELPDLPGAYGGVSTNVPG
jgi:hypothetical protein